MADQNDRSGMIYLVFSLADQPPHERLNSKSLEKAGRDILALNPFRRHAILFHSEIHGIVYHRADCVEGMRLIPPIEEIGDGDTVKLVQMFRGNRKDRDQPVRVAI